jgi:hypothetical protein
LNESYGKVAEEILPPLTKLLFPPTAEPTLPEQTLPLAFIHLRLLAGEDLQIILKRLDRIGSLFGVRGAKPELGTLYLILTALTSTPGKLSSLAHVQSAFFSLLLRRVAGLFDQGMGEDEIRREVAEVWELLSEEAINATLNEARGLWRRSRESHLGVGEIPFEVKEWMQENGLDGEMDAALRRFPHSTPHRHLEILAERLAAIEVLLTGRSPEDVSPPHDSARLSIQESLREGMEGLVPWEAEALRPIEPLIESLRSWSDRLQLLSGGETPTARPGRDRLPDQLRESLEEGALNEGKGLIVAKRFSVGGDTYLAVGMDVKGFSAQLAVAFLLPPVQEEGTCISLRVRFGDGTEEKFQFDLNDGKDLLAAIRLATQPDIRMDLFVRVEDGHWCFAASRYLLAGSEKWNQWLELVMGYLELAFEREEDRIKLAILQWVKA